MTHQEALWQGKLVWVTGILSKSGRLHHSLTPYVGQAGRVMGESKNNQLLINFGDRRLRCVPAGCVADYTTIEHVWMS
jgi:hypothetical protein